MMKQYTRRPYAIVSFSVIKKCCGLSIGYFYRTLSFQRPDKRLQEMERMSLFIWLLLSENVKNRQVQKV